MQIQTRIRVMWETLSGSFWFLPALMMGAAGVLALAMTYVDRTVQADAWGGLAWAYHGGAQGARAMLSVIAGSMITVAGVTFSITMVALSLASSQFGPLVLNNFRQDRGNQVVLGVFISTFLYCLLVLRTVRGSENDVYVPHHAVTLGVVLAVISLGVLIYFIHHMSLAIQAETVIARVGGTLYDTLDRLCRQQTNAPSQAQADTPPVDQVPTSRSRPGQVIRTTYPGYVRSVDYEAIVAIAKKEQLRIQLLCQPGSFLVANAVVAHVWPSSERRDVALHIERAIPLGKARTYLQDAPFIMKQLVAIAVRALSPGINDPFTAISCIDYLSAALCRLAEVPVPLSPLPASGTTFCVVAKPLLFADMVRAAFEPICESGASKIVFLRLLQAVEEIAAHASTPEYHVVLRDQAIRVAAKGHRQLREEDASELEISYRTALEALQTPDSSQQAERISAL